MCAVLNQHTLAPAHRLVSQLCMVDCEEGRSYTGLEPLPFKAVQRAACRQAQMLIPGELADFHRSLQRRLQRDITRLGEYCHSLSTEIARKIVHRQLTGTAREHEQARRHAVALERNRKVAEQREKYALKIEVEPVSFLRLKVPAQVVTAGLRCRKLSCEAFFVWNALLKEFEPATCESCHAALNAVQVCEEKPPCSAARAATVRRAAAAFAIAAIRASVPSAANAGRRHKPRRNLSRSNRCAGVIRFSYSGRNWYAENSDHRR